MLTANLFRGNVVFFKINMFNVLYLNYKFYAIMKNSNCIIGYAKIYKMIIYFCIIIYKITYEINNYI